MPSGRSRFAASAQPSRAQRLCMPLSERAMGRSSPLRPGGAAPGAVFALRNTIDAAPWPPDRLAAVLSAVFRGAAAQHLPTQAYCYAQCHSGLNCLARACDGQAVTRHQQSFAVPPPPTFANVGLLLRAVSFWPELPRKGLRWSGSDSSVWQRPSVVAHHKNCNSLDKGAQVIR